MPRWFFSFSQRLQDIAGKKGKEERKTGKIWARVNSNLSLERGKKNMKNAEKAERSLLTQGKKKLRFGVFCSVGDKTSPKGMKTSAMKANEEKR